MKILHYIYRAALWSLALLPLSARAQDAAQLISPLPVDSVALAADTLAAAPAKELPKFNRGIKPKVFVPKGQIVAGFNASFSQSNQNNYQFFIIESVNGNTGSMKISPWCIYMFRDNLGAGGRVAYTRSRTKMDKANVIFDTETKYSVDDLYSISQSLSTMAVMRAYINLGNSTRFGIVADVQLEYSHSTAKMTNGQGMDFTGSYATTNAFNLGVAPGLVMFLNNYSAIEVNVGMLGLGFKKTNQLTNQVRVQDMRSTVANFSINLFSISIGMSFYL